MFIFEWENLMRHEEAKEAATRSYYYRLIISIDYLE